VSVATLDPTPGSVSANVYLTLAEANQYHDNRPAVGTTWSAATDEQKNQALLWATMLMDSLWCWNGMTTSADQALQWPRSGMLTRNEWNLVPENIIPVELKNATAEYARQLLAGDLAGNSDIETQGITSITAGPVSLSFKESVSAKPVPDTVYNLIPRSWGHPVGRNTGVKNLVRA